MAKAAKSLLKTRRLLCSARNDKSVAEVINSKFSKLTEMLGDLLLFWHRFEIRVRDLLWIRHQPADG